MKSKKIIYLERILRFMAKAVLRRYKPTIVGITGSVGKTSAKEAVFAVLSPYCRVRKNEKNYNNEIGLPLTVMGAESGNRSVLKWIKVFLKWIVIMVFPVKYPKILVLEMGVDRPGDMEYLLSFLKPTVGIMTNISASHLEFFKSIDHIAKEKGKLIKALPENGLAILNGDNGKALALRDSTKAPVISFGSKESSDLKFSDISFNYNNFEPQGISFKLNYEGKVIPIRLPNVMAPHLIYSALAGVAAGLFFKINLIDIAKSLENFYLPCGRMNLIKGNKGSFIIDDSYNSSPIAALAALDVLKGFRALRRIAVMGDMLELGPDSHLEHLKVVKRAFEDGAVMFFAVGDRMGKAVRELEGKISGKIFYFNDPSLAGQELSRILREGDLVLVKGSQGMRMEKAVFESMAFPHEAKEKLCRQSNEWLRKPYQKP